MIQAQITRCDAMARREADRINAILWVVAPVSELVRRWNLERAAARTLILTRYTAAAPAVLDAATRDGVRGTEQALKRLGYDVLRALADSPPASSPGAPDPLLVAPAPFQRSPTLAEARARLATLQARRMDLQARRIVTEREALAALEEEERAQRQLVEAS